MFERLGVRHQIELRSAPTGKKLIVGYAAVFDKRSQDLGGFYEKVAPGTFTKTLQEADVRALKNHDKNYVLGRNKAGTLRMVQDSTGLEYEIDPPDATYARDLMTSIERGDIDQSSFTFRMIKDDWGFDENDQVVRTLQEVQLIDVSPVTFPAYLDSTSGVSGRSALSALAESRGLDLTDLEGNLAAVIRGEYEKPELREQDTTSLYLPNWEQRELAADIQADIVRLTF